MPVVPESDESFWAQIALDFQEERAGFVIVNPLFGAVWQYRLRGGIDLRLADIGVLQADIRRPGILA